VSPLGPRKFSDHSVKVRTLARRAQWFCKGVTLNPAELAGGILLGGLHKQWEYHKRGVNALGGGRIRAHTAGAITAAR